MTKLDIAKGVASFIVGAGTAKIVGQVIENNTMPNSNLDKVTMKAGAFVIGGMAAEATKKSTDQKIDKIASWWKTNVNN